MNRHRFARARRMSLLPLGLLLTAAGLGGCGPISFEGNSPLAVVGTPPPPPEPEPEPPPKRVEVKDNKIVIHEKIQFEFNKANILPESDSLLAEIAKVITENPQIKKIRIEGHASAEGADDYNMKLSDKRAKSVRDHLIKKGAIAEAMLEAQGFGETVPLDTNDTEEGREKNRRVEFTILEQEVIEKRVEVDPETGKETVLEENKKTISAGN